MAEISMSHDQDGLVLCDEISNLMRLTIAMLALAAAAMFTVASWDKPFYTKGEPREAIEMQAIVSGRTVLVPRRNGDEIPSKPPMFHWLGSLFSLPYGAVTEFSARLPSIVGGAATVALTASLGVRLFGAWVGLSAGMLLATAGIFFVAATGARVDMTLAFFITLALSSFIVRYGSGARRPSHLMYAACALAMLTKGPVGAVLPAAIIVVYLLLRRDFSYLLRCIVHPGLAWVLVPLTWYGIAYLQEGQAFVDKLLFKENLYRIFDPDAVEAGHVKPFYAYVLLLLGGFAPWSLMLPAVGVFLWRARKTDALRGIMFAVVWFLVTFTLFSVAGSKRSIYLLPAYPALALLVARWWSLLGGGAGESEEAYEAYPDAYELSGPRLIVWSAWSAAFLIVLPALLVVAEASGLGVFAALVELVHMSEGDRANLAGIAGTLAANRLVFAAWAAGVLVLVVVFVRSLLRAHGRTSLTAAVVLMVASVVVLSVTVQRRVAQTQTVGPMISAVTGKSASESQMYFFDGYDYAAIFYAQRPIETVTSTEQIDDLSRALVLVRQPELERLEAGAREQKGFETVELGRHTYDDNPRREPLLAVSFRKAKALPEPTAQAPGRGSSPVTPPASGLD